MRLYNDIGSVIIYLFISPTEIKLIRRYPIGISPFGGEIPIGYLLISFISVIKKILQNLC
jgi:hypothetical protein